MYGPTQYRMLIEDHLESLNGRAVLPRLMIVGICPGTDFGHVMIDKNVAIADGLLPHLTSPKYFLNRRSHLYRLIAASYHKIGAGDEIEILDWEKNVFDRDRWNTPPLSLAYEKMRHEVELIQTTASQHGIPLLFVVVPTGPMVTKHRETGSETIPSSVLAEIFENLSADYIDLTASFSEMPPGTTHFYFDRHWTEAAHMTAYRALAPAIAR